MGLRAYNRQILAQLISEAHEQGRNEILDELRRAKTPEEIRQILEQDDQSDGSDNDCG